MRDSPGGPAPVAWPGRRIVLTLALGVGVGLPLARLGGAQDSSARGARPQPNDRFVLAAGERKGRLITLADLPSGGAPLTAYPKDATSGVVRDDSRLNQILLVRLDPRALDRDTSARAVDGIVAYSAVCTHEGCPISMWHKDSKTLFCACHASRFDPADRARVVDGPAPRRLAMLPLGPIGGGIVAAGGFTGRVGRQTA